MIIGDCSQFAIEFELDKKYNGTWLYGKFCCWFSNARVGDYETSSSLRDKLIQLAYPVYDNGNRTHEGFFPLNKEAFFYMLDCALYGYGYDISEHEAIELERKSNEETWARFDVSDMIEGWKIFIVENQYRTRVIVKMNGSNEIKEFSLNPKQFDNVIHRAYQAINKLYELEVEKEKMSIRSD